MPDDVQLAQLRQGRGGGGARCSVGISPSSGRSGTSDAGTNAVERPGRLDSKSNFGGSSLYMAALGSVKGGCGGRRRGDPRSDQKVDSSSRLDSDSRAEPRSAG